MRNPLAMEETMGRELDERIITRAILERFMRKLESCLDLDVAIVGAGPSGLVAAHDLAAAGLKVAVFERKLSVGGGMWGGGMMFNEIVVQEEARGVLEKFGVKTEKFQENYFTADSVEAVTTICSKAMGAGAKIFNLMSAEDVIVREKRVCGLVINWTAVEMGGLHVDPLALHARFVVDATGHEAQVVRVVERKVGAELFTPDGRIQGERCMWAEIAERTTLDNTKEVFPGLYVAGMCANAVFGSFRMGPIFGGMLLSGQKVAKLILERKGEMGR
jgi:thiazole biosynthesis enzyme